MPSPERGPSPQPPEDAPRREQQSESYLRVARFPGEAAAGRAYAHLQDAIYIQGPNDLSAFRLALNRVWHVAVLGVPPLPELDQRIDRILARGEPASLPAEVIEALAARRAQAIQRGPWVERHVRPVPPNEPDRPAQDGGSWR